MISLRKLAAGSLAAVLAFSMAACGSDSTDSSADSTSGKVVKVDEKSAKATSLADFGTMDDLVAAAEKEGQLNVIALPHNWSNYGEVINGFKKKYPNIKINELNPNASSKEEVDAAKTNKGTDAAPDVFDLGLAVASTSTDNFAPLQGSGLGQDPGVREGCRRQVLRRLHRHHVDRLERRQVRRHQQPR